jgi:uncharacterized membrane protein
MADIDGRISPPGTALAPRRNLGAGERGLSLAAGALLGGAAARQRGALGVLMAVAGSALVARGVSGAGPAKRLLGERPDERAVAREAGWASAALVSRSVTINAPRSDVWRAFRDIARWPRWALNCKHAEPSGDGRIHLVTTDPAGLVSWDARITEDTPDRVLAIESAPGTPVPLMARYEFRDATGGRGTEIHAAVAYEPPGGSLVRYAAKLSQREPGEQLRRDLKRFKSLLETGEIATNAPQGAAPRG